MPPDARLAGFGAIDAPRRGRLAAPALLAGLLVAASVPPWGFWPLAFAGLGLLAWRLGGLGLGHRVAAGLAFGVGLFGPTLYWTTGFHTVGYGALVLLETSFLVAACAAVPPRPGPALLALPGALVLAEAARGAVPFGGFPMAGIPLGQAAGPLAPAARLGGALLVTGLAVCLGCAVAAAGRRRWAAAGGTVAVVVLAAASGAVGPDGGGDPGGVRRPLLRVAIVQGGGERGLRAVESGPGGVLEAHLAVSRKLAPPLDLVLWPENTVDVESLDGSAEAEALAGVARRLEATVVAGVTESVPDERFQNVAVAWSPQGGVVDRYVKVRRVPFGEHVPLRGLLAPFVDLSVLPRDAVAGAGPGILRTPAATAGVAISYEVFFRERGRAAARAGGEVLLVPTNAASFASSQVPAQELAAARLQAWSTARWVLQSAPTGYSAIIDPSGRVLARSTLGRAEVLRGRAERRTGRTVYVVAGDAPVLAGAVAAVALAWAATARGRRGGTLR